MCSNNSLKVKESIIKKGEKRRQPRINDHLKFE